MALNEKTTFINKMWVLYKKFNPYNVIYPDICMYVNIIIKSKINENSH